MAWPDRAEIASALRGLALLVRGDARALQAYDLSLDGFWRSFRAPLLPILLYIILLPPEVSAVPPEAGRSVLWLVQGLQVLAGWALFLAGIAVLGRLAGLDHRFGIFTVLYNWAQAFVTAASLPVLALTGSGLLPPDVLAGWSVALLPVWMFIVARIARLGLQAALPVAVACALLDLVISVLLHRLAEILL